MPKHESLLIKRVKKVKKVKEVQEMFHCDKCPRRYHLKTALEAHLRAHARAEKPKKAIKGACPHCNNSFERLDIHLKLVHGEDIPDDDERPYLCRFCSKSCTRYGREQPRIGMLVLGHSLICLLIRSYRSLIRWLHSRALLRSFVCLLAQSLPNSWEKER